VEVSVIGRNLQNFILFFSEFNEENVEEMEEELLQAGINSEKSKGIILQQLKKAKAELKIERGKAIIEKYQEKLKNIAARQSVSANTINELAFEYRKLSRNLDREDLEQLNEEIEKLKILSSIINDEEKEMNG
jgi:uncharacterized membrane-anchored protein YhcB (DUF1043 family)